jgi:hypothetical protein
MIRVPVLFIMFILLAGAAMAAEMNVTNNTTLTGELNLTSLTNLTPFSNASVALNETAGEDPNLTQAGQGNASAAGADAVVAETTPAKPVYRQSIGSTFSAGYKEPEARTFTSSGC